MPLEMWNHPTYVRSSAWHMQEVSILNEKLLSVGLIDYTGNNVAQITAIGNFNMGSAPNALEVDLGALYYQLPVGDDSIQFNDVIGEDYKTIDEESYSSTECYIKIRVLMTKTNNDPSSGRLLSDNRYYKFNFSISFSKTPLFTGLENQITMWSNGTSVTSSSMNYTNSTASSIVYLTGDTLHISFLHVGQDTAHQSQVTTFYNPHHLITFTLHRSEGEITIYHPTYVYSIPALTVNTSNSIMMQPRILVIDKNNIQFLITDQSSFIQSGVSNYIPLDSSAKKYFLFTYCEIFTGIRVNPTVLKGLAASASTNNKIMNYSDVVIKYRGERVKLRYFDYGEFWMPFRWSALNNANLNTGVYTQFSYHILINDHPCTTNSVEYT